MQIKVTGFSLGRLHMGGQSVNGGTHEGGHRPYGGLTLIDYKLKVLLMLSCNYRMQFIGYNSIKTR